MRTRLVRIGNSRGIRIPKVMLDRAGLADEVDIQLCEGALVISPVAATRAGWDEAFRQMAARGDDAFIHDEELGASSWDDEEWEW